MLRTPTTFTSLLVAQDHPAPFNLVFCGDALLVREADLALPNHAALRQFPLDAGQFLPVGMLEGRYCQTAWLEPGCAPLSGFAFRKLRSLFGAIDESLLAVAGRAYQIADWARTHRYCGACATPTVQAPGERCLRCPACSHSAYPRISPAMMVLIRNEGAILLARHTHSPTRFFTALAGFLEAGESIEDAVHREVYEEVGLTVTNLSYFGSPPWPFPPSLMIAYTADYLGGTIKVDQSEIAEARWFGPDDAFPNVPPLGLSIAGHLIDAHRPRQRRASDGDSGYSPR